jgi:hypothetical protein
LDFRLSEKIAGNQSDLAALLLIGKRRFKPGGEQTLLGNFVALAANYTSPGAVPGHRPEPALTLQGSDRRMQCLQCPLAWL